MKHLGDIRNIKGNEIPKVDVITGGSPCQDLSVAGKREGLKGERSGLFLEQIRIIKEMREDDRASGRTDEFIRPRYMVFENVPGLFSSNINDHNSRCDSRPIFVSKGLWNIGILQQRNVVEQSALRHL